MRSPKPCRCRPSIAIDTSLSRHGAISAKLAMQRIRTGNTVPMRYRLKVDAVIEAASYQDALYRIAEHFGSWADDTPTDDPDSWRSVASLAAPRFEVGSLVHLVTESD